MIGDIQTSDRIAVPDVLDIAAHEKAAIRSSEFNLSVVLSEAWDAVDVAVEDIARRCSGRDRIETRGKSPITARCKLILNARRDLDVWRPWELVTPYNFRNAP